MDTDDYASHKASLSGALVAVKRDLENFGSDVATSKRAVKILDLKMAENLEELRNALANMSTDKGPSTDVPLVLVSSLLPFHGGKIGGYTVSVARAGADAFGGTFGGRDSPNLGIEAMPAAIACPKLSETDKVLDG